MKNNHILDLVGHKIENLEQIELDQAIQAITLRQNQLVNFKTNKDFSQISFLDISFNNIKSLDQLSVLFPNLIVLHAQSNFIKYFNDGYFPILQYLDLSKNQLTNVDQLPTRCKYVNFSNNMITSLNLQSNSLIELNISQNKLESIILDCQELKSINISNNQFNFCSSLISLLHMPQLEFVDFSNNHFQTVKNDEILTVYQQITSLSLIEKPYSLLICNFTEYKNVIIRQDSNSSNKIKMNIIEYQTPSFQTLVPLYQLYNFVFDTQKSQKFKHRRQVLTPDLPQTLQFPDEIDVQENDDIEVEFDSKFVFPPSSEIQKSLYLQILPFQKTRLENLEKISEKIIWAGKNDKFKDQLKMYQVQFNQLFTFKICGVNVENMQRLLQDSFDLQMQPILSRIMEINPDYFSLPGVTFTDNQIQPLRIKRFNINSGDEPFYLSNLELENCDINFMKLSENQDLTKCVKCLKITNCSLKEPKDLSFLQYFTKLEHLTIDDELLKNGFNHVIGSVISPCQQLLTFNSKKYENLYKAEIINFTVQERIISQILNKQFEIIQLPFVNTSIFE